MTFLQKIILKKQVKEKITKLKHGELTEDEFYQLISKKQVNFTRILAIICSEILTLML